MRETTQVSPRVSVTAAARLAAVMLLAGTAFLYPSADAGAQQHALSGAWRGGGWVSFATGQRERARCRAHFTPRSESVVIVNATCATESGSIQQTARLRKTGANTYSGSFHNEEYGVSGSISVSVRGNTQNVRLTSDSGGAVLTLRR
jgi:hypothetical protein